ncbi:uncharacterized protein P174DRAFT_287489 [Aspergillus novofumigatus IBT 16806]|uniref:Uncharacterized protein n=1 Tax=Aspergillus novofumigatus (strain IBT 16806) TaxID=1392255 RepID=A0A2I1BX31_ASPN1|nr:uncharacterized protein P174DRAFT_287489 [Aspergillus novofumigatus IBT 16806]PKX89944.1 hypothetical protein P174DRAFT_287489 [Aspergillus novofumigatus IBT 16806]
MAIHCECPARKGVQVTGKVAKDNEASASRGDSKREANPIYGISMGQELPFRVFTYQASRARNSLAMHCTIPTCLAAL